MSFLRRPAGFAWLLLCCVVVPAKASDRPPLPGVIGVAELYLSHARSGLGLSGYDPVSYQVDGRAIAGSSRHEATWAGLVWRFASEPNRAAFLRDPNAFLPRLGGYDAAAALAGRLSDADPTIFAVQAGRLYMFRAEAGRRRFLQEPDAAGLAERGWARLSDELPRG